MPSNPQNLIRSWNTQANFANGRVVMDRLTPPAFTRIRTPFVMTWREDNAVVNNLGREKLQRVPTRVAPRDSRNLPENRVPAD